ncbi:MAG: vWA domain-containing protein, partial [Myxococcota bacterium]
PGPIEILAADVVIAIDRSTSTRKPTGLDLDGDGVVGEFRRSEYTDREDSLLAAQLAAVQRLVDVARLGGMRFAIVSYSGRHDFPLEDSVTQRVERTDARLEAELTDDPAALEAAVARIGERGSDGASSFAPAMRLALLSLSARNASDEPARRRRVLFLSDSPTPVRYAPMYRIAYDDARMEVEARRAIKSGVAFHSFGLGEAANAADTPHVLAQIAGATGGTYRAVPDPRDLYCQMLAALGASDPVPGLRAR